MSSMHSHGLFLKNSIRTSSQKVVSKCGRQQTQFDHCRHFMRMDMNIFRKVSESVCTSAIVVYPDHLSPTPSTFLAIEISENKEDKLITLNHHMKETFKWNIPLISCTAQV
jgi:hypothetical protein